MRVAMCALFVAAAAGCLRSTEFRCAQDSDCGAAGTCELNRFCSVPDTDCQGTGRAYGDSAGQGLSGSCVPTSQPGPGNDAGIDAPIDGMPAGCPSGYAPVAGSAHRYKLLTALSWDEAARDCRLTSAAAYLAVPDDPAELANLATVATPPFWTGIHRAGAQYVIQNGGPAMFLPWAPGQPDSGPPAKDCVDAVSGTQIATDRCGNQHAAICECEPGS
jgi:hypothetical protein